MHLLESLDIWLLDHLFQAVVNGLHGRTNGFQLARCCIWLAEMSAIGGVLIAYPVLVGSWRWVVACMLGVSLIIAPIAVCGINATERLARRSGCNPARYTMAVARRVSLPILCVLPMLLAMQAVSGAPGVALLAMAGLILGTTLWGASAFFASCAMPPPRRVRDKPLALHWLAQRA